MKLQDDIIYEFLDACYSAGIKNPAHYLIAKRPQVYDWLVGVFPRGILPTDVDGEVEINGYYLRLEFKHENALRNGWVSRGQLRALKNLTSTGKFTVFIIGTNDRAKPCCIEIYKSTGSHTPLEDITVETLQEKCRQWAVWAEQRERAS